MGVVGVTMTMMVVISLTMSVSLRATWRMVFMATVIVLKHTQQRRYYYIQWNPSNLDTNGAEISVIVSEVSSFQRLKCMQEWYLGWEKVSCLERCPQFRRFLREREVPL